MHHNLAAERSSEVVGSSLMNPYIIFRQELTAVSLQKTKAARNLDSHLFIKERKREKNETENINANPPVTKLDINILSIRSNQTVLRLSFVQRGSIGRENHGR